jgi:nitroreductase
MRSLLDSSKRDESKGDSMRILEAVMQRRSIRDFKVQDIPQESIDMLVEAIRWAPSAGNLQSRKFYFIFDQEIRKKLAEAALNQNFIAQAPLVVVACLDRHIAVRYGDRGVNLYSIQDVAASIMNLMLVAHEMRLGTCWVGAFNEFDVVEILDLPDHLRPIAIVPVGYPGRVPEGRQKRITKEDTVQMVR